MILGWWDGIRWGDCEWVGFRRLRVGCSVRDECDGDGMCDMSKGWFFY